ncbi:Gamma-glutamyltranspeptidase (EC @ Glutathione hydrolase (EC [Amycolatopsis camponoti]|uniref:Gamma-glutamyltranspeptidase ) n=1 Tax=Amycolatopsis camponoti TaxID=2606593 RepID=A0A6I8LLJ7_9PSEU|nr:gamma-glutamyltransferase family protein [Amycolatopsis camponoti]VVJ17743.1 Gamma-glutamyltranspeptidase (EC @ Glutathione hydrolase (EC [Amycolatopsis camponoti]
MLDRPELLGTRGAVSSTHWLASAAGTAMFDLGGNAFDAAVATALVIQVVEPHLNGPGGDVPILVHDGATGDVEVICGQGPMPEAATPQAFRDRGVDAIPGSGLLPAVVPGAFGAWLRLLRDRGRLDLGTVLAPAIAYAEDGFPLLPKAADMIAVLAPLFREEWTASGEVYLPDGRPPKPGSRLRNRPLAATYRRILAESEAAPGGRENRIDAAVAVFYQGFVAEAIDKFLATAEPLDSTGRRNGGLLTGHDLASWRPTIEPAVTADYRGHTVHKAGPWSQGPVFLQQLGLLEGFDLAAMDHGGAEHLHTVVECAKLAFADREAFYGDPAFSDVPLRRLLDPEYAAARRELVGERACGELRPGLDGWFPEPPLPAPADPDWRAQLADGIPAVVKLTAAKGDTCCISASDRDGNMVVATPSGGWLKSSPVIPGLGFPLGTRGQMALLEEGHPNTVAPGKRPRTTLSPTLVTKEGRPHLAFGTPGGDQQDQWTLNFFLSHVDAGLRPQAAIEQRAFHTDQVPSSFAPRSARPNRLVVETGCPAEVVEQLRDRGHDVVLAAEKSLGKVCATGFEGDLVLAAASPRGQQAYAVAR